MDAAEFHEAVYHVVRQIPHASVTSYGHIAKLVGKPTYSRHVGQALKFLGPQDNNANPVPWQRVIASDGTISSRAGADRQRQALEAEGVEVTTGRTGDMRVNLQQYGWFPAVGTVDLPVQATTEAETAVDEEQWYAQRLSMQIS